MRLAVAERTGPGRFQVLAHHREVTALAQGLAQTGELAPEAMARTQEALRGFLQIMKDYHVRAFQTVATHAVRQARNGQVFLGQLRDMLGLTVRVLSPEEEARLSLKGVLSVLSPHLLREGPVVVFDVGGGSSEWALLRPGGRPQFASLPLGVLTLSQSRPLGDPPQPERLKALRQDLTERLGSFYQESLRPWLGAPPRLVGTAGAVTTLAALHLKMTDYDPERVNNLVLTRTQVEELTELLSSLSEQERARLPGMEPAKAGVMVAGALIILTILEVIQQDALVVIDAGLLEGVLGELAAANNFT